MKMIRALALALYGYFLYSSAIFWLFNRKAIQEFSKHPTVLSPVQKKTLEHLKQDGIVALDAQVLGADLSILFAYAESEKQRYFSQPKCQTPASGKDYLERFPYTGSPKPLDLQNPFIQFVTSPQMVDLVNAYSGQWMKLINVNFWYCNPAVKGPILSQNWHRDWDDPYLIKFFLYLNDVSETEGAFQFVPKSHDQGPYGYVIKRHPTLGKYANDQIIAEKFPIKPQVFEGKAGALVIADTSGFHKGGFVTNPKGYRYLFYGMFTSRMGIHPLRARALKRNFLPPVSMEGLSSQAQYAVS